MAKGKFIVLEGIDGSGKSTHAVLLKERLEQEGYRVFLTCEPTEGEAGRLLRRCLTGEADLPEQAIAGLFMTDRIDHILNAETGLLSHLAKGEIVLCDRYYFSSFAYNSLYAPMDWVIAINRIARETLRPDLTVFLDILPESFLSRIESRGKKERYEKADLLRRVRENYRKAFELLPEERVAVVDNTRPLAEAAEDVYLAVKKVLEG